MYMRICMVKVISLSEEAYGILKTVRGKEESFSDVIVKLARKRKGNIMSLFGCAKEDKELIQGLKRAYRERDKIELRIY